MAKQHKKPTGNLSLYKLSSSEKEEIKIQFPETKDNQETSIIELFIKLVKTNELINFPVDGYERNREQDLDFTIVNKNEKSLLELTELIPTDNMKGGYASVSSLVDPDKLVKRLINIIDKKSKKYVGIKMPIDLLIYVTDNNSNISIGAERYLKSYLNSNPNVFRFIFYFVPMLEINDGIIIQYYPNKEGDENIEGPLGSALNLKF